MTEYKSYRIIDEKPQWVIVDENGQIINRNPSKEELRRPGKEILLPYTRGNKKIIKYNDTNSCDICRKDFSLLGWTHPYREYDDKGNWTGRWTCNTCFQKVEHKKRMLSDRRTGNLNPNSNQALGDNLEELTDKLFETKRLSVFYDKYSRLPLDHFDIPNSISVMIQDKLVDLSGKVPQTTGRTYNPNGGQYSFGHLERDYGKDFDIYILYCISRDNKIIERIYIIPKGEFKNRTGVSIIKKPMNSRGTNSIVPWYEQYRITDKETMKKVNTIWKEVIGEQ